MLNLSVPVLQVCPAVCSCLHGTDTLRARHLGIHPFFRPITTWSARTGLLSFPTRFLAMLFHPAQRTPRTRAAESRSRLPGPRARRLWGGIPSGWDGPGEGRADVAMMPSRGGAGAGGEHRPPLRSHEAVPALCSRGSGRAGLTRREAGGAAPSRMRWGTAGRSGAAGCSSGGTPAASSAAEGEQQPPVPLSPPRAGRCRGRRLRLPRGAGGGTGQGGDAGSGCARGPWAVPFGIPGVPGGWRCREPAGLRAVCAAGADALPGSPAPVRSQRWRLSGRRRLEKVFRSAAKTRAGGRARAKDGKTPGFLQCDLVFAVTQRLRRCWDKSEWFR